MSQKNLDRKKRWRNVTIAFRVSEDENKRINELVAMSGMTKQDYITQRLENETITVVANNLLWLIYALNSILNGDFSTAFPSIFHFQKLCCRKCYKIACEIV